jgi:hypothetical protein
VFVIWPAQPERLHLLVYSLNSISVSFAGNLVKS